MKDLDDRSLSDIIEKKSGIVIYGAGVLGQGMYCYLKKIGYEDYVQGFAVSPNVDHLNEYMGKRIRQIGEYDLEKVVILVAVKRIYLSEIADILKGFFNVWYVRADFLKVRMEKQFKDVIPELFISKIKEMELTDEQAVSFYIRQIRRKRLDFEINLVDHCNLNCQCCNHFSPIASKYFLEIDKFECDLIRINELTKGDVGRIWLIGGEPLLHPDLIKFLYVARKHFPLTHITLDTNGTLLLRQEDSFWEALRNTGIELTLTKYPVNVDYEKIDNKMRLERVKYAYTLSSANVVKTSYHLPLNLDGGLDKVKNYIRCWHANECITLRDGRFYPCPIAAHAHYFNEFFGKDLYVGDLNSISIYEVEDISEILSFLKKPIPFCGHCDIEGYTFDIPWKVSRRDIKEWTYKD